MTESGEEGSVMSSLCLGFWVFSRVRVLWVLLGIGM